MKKIKKFLMLFLVMAGVLALGSETAVQAAKVRLSKKELTLEIGNRKRNFRKDYMGVFG